MTDFLPVSQWGLFPDGDRPFVIAGPCSAESKEQILHCAHSLMEMGIGVMRAGLWKPRTRPGCFEGVGERGLEWLLEAARETGIKVCTEVGSAAHARAALDAGLDMVWIGARTTANPFQVQEIADALQGSDIPVLVKNPVSPDADLWAGAIERLSQGGRNKVAAVLRGFTTLEKGHYRNNPVWEIAGRIEARFPGLTIFADPSHIGGNIKYVAEISQRALDLGFDSLMIEAHPNPSQALSDAAQQLSFPQLKDLLGSLRPRRAGEEVSLMLEELRSEIDSIDSRLLTLLASRMEISSKIGLLKKENNIPILQSGRWETLLARLKEDAAAAGLDPAMVERIFNVIHEYSLKEQ